MAVTAMEWVQIVSLMFIIVVFGLVLTHYIRHEDDAADDAGVPFSFIMSLLGMLIAAGGGPPSSVSHAQDTAREAIAQSSYTKRQVFNTVFKAAKHHKRTVQAVFDAMSHGADSDTKAACDLASTALEHKNVSDATMYAHGACASSKKSPDEVLMTLMNAAHQNPKEWKKIMALLHKMGGKIRRF